MSIQISISDVRESLQVFANGNTANAFTVVKGTKALAQKDADVSANKAFKLGTFDLPNFVDNDKFVSLFRAFFAENNITRSAIVSNSAEFTIVLEVCNCKYRTEYSFARIHVYCTVPATTFLQTGAEEVAQIQEAAELEEAILENETPVFVGLEFVETEMPEADNFIKNKGGYAYFQGKYAYQWGSYEYILGSLRGSDVCAQGVVIAEHIETVEEAYEIAKKHYQNWVASQPTPTRTETLAKEIFNDALAQNPLIQQDFGQSAHAQIIDVCADSTFAGLGISAQRACALPQPQAEIAPAETVGNPETPQTDPYLAERPIDETITAKEFYSYADPETLTDSEIRTLFDFDQCEERDAQFYSISIGKRNYQLILWANDMCDLLVNTSVVMQWDAENLKLSYAEIIREAYILIYKDLCQISPFAPRETIINLDTDKGLSDMQVREVEKSLLIGINTAENFIIYNARAEYDTKAARWLCVGKDHKTGKRLEGYINACKIIHPYLQTL